MNNVDLFKDKYLQLEKIVKDKYHISKDESPICYLLKLKPFMFYKNGLNAAREIRNLLSHEYLKDGEDYYLDINSNLLKLLEDVHTAILHPVTCYQLAIKDVYTATLDDYVLPRMHIMKKNVYTHIPIIEQKKVIGAFSENTLFAFMLQAEIIEINEKTKFIELNDYLILDNHINEKFVFIKRNEPVTTAEEIFIKAFENNERLNMIFVTQNGKQDEALLGIITPWDILGRNTI